MEYLQQYRKAVCSKKNVYLNIKYKPSIELFFLRILFSINYS